MPLPTEPAELLDIGRRVHEKIEFPTIPSAAAHFGVPDSRIFVVLRQYRDSAGIVTEGQRRAIAGNAKRLKARHAKPAKPKANGNGAGTLPAAIAASLVHAKPRLPPAGLARLSAADKARIAELEDQLDHATEEIEAMRKILMVVARAL